jgi:hypothetical protein
VGFEFVSSWAPAKNHDNRLNAAGSHMIDAGFNDGFLTEGKQRLKCTHALGTPGSEDYGCNCIGL